MWLLSVEHILGENVFYRLSYEESVSRWGHTDG
jgi:hypothetical protein